MKVVIEKTVAFDSTNCRLWNVQTADDVAISLLLTQLLKLLIEYQGFAVSRNEIFEKIFDANGAHATNNNLNQNISVLRKHLAQLGITNEVITTVTRVGFMINDIVLIEADDGPAPGRLTEATPVLQRSSAAAAKKNPKKISGLFMIAIVVMLFAIFYKQSSRTTQLTPENLPLLSFKKISDIEGCEINKLSVRGAGDDYFTEESFQSVVNKLKCDMPENTQFYISKNTVSNNNFRGFTLKCIRAASGQYDCYSFYESVEVD